MFVIYQIEVRPTGKDHYKLLAEFDELKEASEYLQKCDGKSAKYLVEFLEEKEAS